MFNQGIYHQSTQMAGGFVGGSGTLNYVPKWTPNGVTIGNSQMFDNGTNVGVATALPSSKFTVLAAAGDGIKVQSSISSHTILLSGGNNSIGPSIACSFVLGVKTPDAEMQIGRSSGTGRALIYVDSTIVSGLHLSGNNTGGNAIILDTSGNTSMPGTLAVGTTIALTGAQLHVSSAGNTSAGFAFRVDSSTVSNLFYVRNDGAVSSLNGYWIGSEKIFYINPNGTTANIFIGDSSGNSTLTGGTNTALGSNTLSSITSGSFNIAFGYQALRSLTSGSYCVAIGSQSLFSNSTSDSNTAIGYRALFSSTTSQNTAIGAYAIGSGASGGQNTAIGYNCMYGALAAAINNVAIGVSVLSGGSFEGAYNVGIGNSVGTSVTTGSENVIIGYSAVPTVLTTGSKLTIIGTSTSVSNAADSGSIAIGHGAVITGNNQFVVGSAATNAGTITAEAVTSDATWLVNINGTNYKILLKQ